MSRGPGRWQRLLLHELYHKPKVAPNGARYIDVARFATTPSELSAVYRAARTLRAKGWVDTSERRYQFITLRQSTGGRLDALPDPPAVAANCSLCAVSVQQSTDPPRIEHLSQRHRIVAEKLAAMDTEPGPPR